MDVEFTEPLHDLQIDLLNNSDIFTKCMNSEIYRGDLYSALCNNRFFYGDTEWSCSWRFAGGLVSDIVGFGDYMDYYASGKESIVTDEIRDDLLKMGWTIKPYHATL